VTVHALESDASLDWLTGTACRLCGGYGLESVFDLGTQAIGSYFPATPDERVPTAPLDLVRCPSCSLVQLSQGCDHADVYGTGHYGYRSGLNPAMVRHLSEKAEQLTKVADLHEGDVVLDIGCNDGTLLGSFDPSFRRVGIDPTSPQFRQHVPKGLRILPSLFSAEAYRTLEPGRKAKLITSLSVLYDLEDPRAFAADVAESLAPDGLWHFEQCYLPTMLAANSYDTICHEHLTYYTIKTVAGLLESVGMRIVGVELNDVNGGSFAVTACKIGQHADRLSSITIFEETSEAELASFASRSRQLRDELVNLVRTLNSMGDSVGAIGASTKGNTILQYCGFGPQDIAAIGEVNADKVGRFTPSSHIPIVADADVLECDYLLVLPWHFRSGIVERMHGYLQDGGRLIFPLPTLEVVKS
jgi:hypothetical protein